ncbi:MAG: hypothetical protein JRN26_08265 [Nitrososphaerota archaeon]|jgi:hypothetical protein|nr:hypothetical protein [Nitrososphaerota archaeon]
MVRLQKRKRVQGEYDRMELERESRLGKNYKWIAFSNTTLGAHSFKEENCKEFDENR